jgi:hypothetical protein
MLAAGAVALAALDSLRCGSTLERKHAAAALEQRRYCASQLREKRKGEKVHVQIQIA